MPLAAHEVAHDVLLHSLRAQDAAALVDFFAEVLSVLGGANPGGEANIRGWLGSVTMPRYSRVQELEADTYALELLAAKGYQDPREVFISLLQELLDLYGDGGGGLLDSHPATSERIERVEDRPDGSVE